MATIEFMPARLTAEETEQLRQAVACLEGTSFAQRLTDAVGRPVAMLSRTMPQSARRVIAHASETALRGALKLALRTLDLKTPAKPANRAHKLAAAASGAVGGALGLAALPVELPISTTILLRSIAEIAREEGEDLSAPNAALACVEVFALGGQADGEAALESGYFAVRAALAKSVSDSARFVATEGLTAQSAPVIARLISQIAVALRRRGQREARRPGGADSGRDRRRGGQRRLRRPFPDAGPRAFHRPAPGASARPERSRVRISAPARRAGARSRGEPKGCVVKRDVREPGASAQAMAQTSRPGVGGGASRPHSRARLRRPKAAGPPARRAADAFRSGGERRPRLSAQLPRMVVG